MVVASLFFSGAALALLALCRAAQPHWVVDVGQWVRPRPVAIKQIQQPPLSYVAQHYRLIMRTAVLEVGLAVGLVGIAYYFGPSDWREGRERQQDVMWVALHQTATNPKRSVTPFAMLVMTDGCAYYGQVVSCDSENDDYRNIVLAAPVLVLRPGKLPVTSDEAMPVPHRLVLPLARIAECWLDYHEKKPKPRRRPTISDRQRPASAVKPRAG